MSLRTSIYYWKCDNPQSDTEKRQSYFKEKYERSDLPQMVEAAFVSVFNKTPESIEPLRADGNHIAYIVSLGGTQFFFRADDGEGEDEYLLAESRVMQLATEAGVPVPEVFHTDVSRSICPLRYQIMACCEDPCLNQYDRDGTLEHDAIADQLGKYMRRLHSVRVDGFGFLNTDELKQSGRVVGLDASNGAYFNKCLDDHLGYLIAHSLIDEQTHANIRDVFEAQTTVLDRPHGVLVHRDMALWNVLGTPSTITAIIDWDDAVSGDPADDIGMLYCFYGDAFMDRLLSSYWAPNPVPPDFRHRLAVYWLRNMLWKTKLRHALGYFDKDGAFFLNAPGEGRSLWEVTQEKLQTALQRAMKGAE